MLERQTLVLRYLHIDKVISLILLCGFTFLSYNEVANFHTHITIDGRIVSHSHPYNNSKNDNGKANHNHSNVQFVQFDKLGHQFLGSIYFDLAEEIFAIRKTDDVSPDESKCHKNQHLLLNQFRAPPIL